MTSMAAPGSRFLVVLGAATLFVAAAQAQIMTNDDDAYCAAAGGLTPYCEGWSGSRGHCAGFATEDRARECRRGRDAREARDRERSQAKQRSDEERERRRLLAMPPLPPAANPLLGQWRRTGSVPTSGGAVGELIAGLSGIACATLEGPGPSFEFRADALVHGGRAVSPMQYRAGPDGVVYAFGAPGLLEQLAFRFDGRDRMTLSTCTYARGGTGGAAASAAAPRPREAAATSSPRPAPEVCRQVLIDRIGEVRVDEARRAIGLRFRESVDGRVPGSSNLRVEARGSACDDARVDATLYDFDGAGVLRSVTIVWTRPAGPAPAEIFSERVRMLSMFYAAGPSSTSRWQGAAAKASVVLEDRPERERLLEAYSAPK